ncbi:MAG: cytochrome c nitrite reductase small subunit [Candidatus Sumerlaeaceae bacterium]|nr:cytochrome c nitrite reductase small subunit [Candidatus Sumerlaeaceae bacterium]
MSSLVIGVGAGVGGFTFVYAKGGSYMTNDPKACANCHVMTAQYDGWQKSSHHAVAVCNDCHTPHNFIGKWTTKALNGYHHSLAFTTQNFHEPIQIGPRNLEITENACRNCHADITQQIDHMAFAITAQSSPISCIHCHKNVGHME